MISWQLFAFLILALSSVTLSQNDDEDCPFSDGSCPVTLDNVVDVYFHDIADRRSCQRECQQIGECKFFTMFGVNDDPTDHMKCFLFKTCDTLEPCDECTTGMALLPTLFNFLAPHLHTKNHFSGPDYPPIDNCTSENYTCGTELNNIVDVFYFDAEDTVSCKQQCQMLPTCNFWTQFDETDDPQPHHKCFLFKNCNIHEDCAKCETGTKNRRIFKQEL